MPANGSKSVALDVGYTFDFLGKFNVNYNSEDRSQQNIQFTMWGKSLQRPGISKLFPPPRWYLMRDPPTPKTTSTIRSASTSTGTSTTSNPSRHLAAASTVTLTTSARTSASASITAPKTYHQSPSSATVIGLSIGTTFGIAAICLVGFLYWMRKKKMPDRRRSHGMSQKPAPLVSDARTR